MSNTTEKIQQTVENTRYVFASTDVTAIYSFVIAAMIGVIVALLGVFLAWWYGKKSFDLTTQSFNTTIKQIDASIDSARNNTELAINSAKDSYERQLQLKRKELIFQSRQIWLNDLRDTSVLYLECINKQVIFFKKKSVAIGGVMKPSAEDISKIAEDVIDMNRVAYKIELLFNPNGEDERKILEIMEGIKVILVTTLPKIIASDGLRERKDLDQLVEGFKTELRNLLKKEWEKTKALE